MSKTIQELVSGTQQVRINCYLQTLPLYAEMKYIYCAFIYTWTDDSYLPSSLYDNHTTAS